MKACNKINIPQFDKIIELFSKHTFGHKKQYIHCKLNDKNELSCNAHICQM